MRLAGLVAAAAIVVGFGWGTAAADTTTTVAPTTTTTTAPASFSAEFVPCDPVPESGPCTAEPTQIKVASAATVAWTPQGSAAPAKDTAALNSGTNPWPSSLTDGGSILNGTYKVTSGSSSVTIRLAAPAPPPATVRSAYSSTTGVTVTWTRPSPEPPDAVGYEVIRAGAPVYDCSTSSSGPLTYGRCPAGLDFYDAPGTGSWTYGVSTLRYGAGPAASQVVGSLPAKTTVYVPVAPSAPVTTPTGGGGPLLTVPTLPIPHTIVAVPPSAGLTPPTAPASTATSAPPTTAEGSPALPYHPSRSPAAALGPAETGPKDDGLDTWAAVAVGLLTLALAAHAWYVRGELRRFDARRRRATTTHGEPLAP